MELHNASQESLNHFICIRFEITPHCQKYYGAQREIRAAASNYRTQTKRHRLQARVIVRCLSVLNVHFCKKSRKLAQMTFDRDLSNPDIGRTFWDGLTHSN